MLAERREGPLAAWLGRVKVTQRVVGFERRRIHGGDTIDQLPLDLPPTYFETVALWWAAPAAFEDALRCRGEHFMGALHAAEHAAISLFPLLAICDRGDIGGISYPFHPQVSCGAVFIYDGHPGGVGIARRGFDDLPELLSRVADLLDRCDCEDGCPSCIQSPKCGNGNRPLDKAGAARVVWLLLGREAAEAEEAGKERLEPVMLRLDAPVEPRTRRRPVVARESEPLAPASQTASPEPVTAASPPAIAGVGPHPGVPPAATDRSPRSVAARSAATNGSSATSTSTAAAKATSSSPTAATAPGCGCRWTGRGEWAVRRLKVGKIQPRIVERTSGPQS